MLYNHKSKKILVKTEFNLSQPYSNHFITNFYILFSIELLQKKLVKTKFKFVQHEFVIKSCYHYNDKMI